MGSGSFDRHVYASYSVSNGRTYDENTGRVSGQQFVARRLDASLDPRHFTIRECANSKEHPNTIPVILALDVTGSMGAACKETAEALGVIMEELYRRFQDIEFCVMGIGDLAYDQAPIQMSQFESDIRIAEALDKIYIEGNGGGNQFESYTAAWYMGLKRTRLDCFDKQGRKGIIITMGDEPLNPYLPKGTLNAMANASEQGDVETPELYEQVIKKFDVYHIAVDDEHSSYRWYASRIEESFKPLLGDRLKVSKINNLSTTIIDCISDSLNSEAPQMPARNTVNENGEISW